MMTNVIRKIKELSKHRPKNFELEVATTSSEVIIRVEVVQLLIERGVFIVKMLVFAHSYPRRENSHVEIQEVSFLMA